MVWRKKITNARQERFKIFCHLIKYQEPQRSHRLINTKLIYNHI